MRILLAILLALAVGGCGGCAGTPEFHSTTSFIQIGVGHCSGTAVGPRAVLTAAHCFPTDIPIVLVNGRVAKVQRFERDGADHVLLKLDITLKTWAKLGKAPQVGDQVCMYGNPGALKDVYRCGLVSGKYQNEILFDINAFHGDSGAGLFDRRGRLVGVVMGGFSWLTPVGMHFQITRARPLAFTAAQWKAVGA